MFLVPHQTPALTFTGEGHGHSYTPPSVDILKQTHHGSAFSLAPRRDWNEYKLKKIV